MLTHQAIDARLLRMVERCVEKIDTDPTLLGRMHCTLARYSDERIRSEWETLLALPWPVLRARLLDPSPEGDRLRQDAPLGGLLTPRERLPFFRPTSHSPDGHLAVR